MSRIEAKPTEGHTLDPNDEKYWDRRALDGELERVYDICHGCRMCFNLCPSFPTLFAAVDEHDGDVRSLTPEQHEQVVDECWGCKVCYIKCPYTPDDGHEFQLDFPRLILRARALRARKEGIPLRERILTDPVRLGKMATKTARLANWGNQNKLGRAVMEKTLGVHRDKQLPDFASETFEKWLRKRGGPDRKPGGNAKVALFYTCTVNYNNPEPGKATLRVLERNECDVQVPNQNCCGMPALDCGDIERAQAAARGNIESFLPLVRDGYRVAAINPTCSMMIRKEYPLLLGTPEAQEVAKAVADPHELLWELKKDNKLNRGFKSTPGTIAYHVPCHLRAQNIGYRSRDIMRLIPGTEITLVDACTAHDGTWAMKREYFDLSMKWGAKAFDRMKEPGANIMATDCPLAAVQIEQGTGTRPLHPAEVIDRAYEADGWPTPVESEPE